MSEYVERLRASLDHARADSGYSRMAYWSAENGAKLLDTIEALTAERDRAREALVAITKVRVNGWDNIWAGRDRCRDIACAALGDAS